LPAEQIAHPFESFEPALSPYQMIRGILTELFQNLEINIHSKSNPYGSISAPNYMALLQKLTAKIYNRLLSILYSIDENYDFKEDPGGYKTRKVQKNTAKLLREEDKDGNDYLTLWVNYHQRQIVNNDIPEIISEIDAGRGKITSTIGSNTKDEIVININDEIILTFKEKITKKDEKAISEFILERLRNKK
jgi:hypothetical protein